MPDYHAPFGGSNAARWVNCIGYRRLANTVPVPPTNRAAIEGTAQHSCMETMLRNPAYTPDNFLNVTVGGVHITQQHVEAMTKADDAVQAIVNQFPETAELYAERFLIFQEGDNADEPKAGGSADLMVAAGRRAAMCDFKFGQIEVGADSTQNKFYMASALRSFPALCDVEEFTGYIIQPAFDPVVVSEVYTRADIERFTVEFDVAIDRNEHEPPTYTEGSWCAFCPAAIACPAKRDRLPSLLGPTHTFDINDAADWWLDHQSLESTERTMRDRLLHELEHGTEIEGLKLVARRTEMQWRDPVAAFQELIAAGHDQNSIVKMISPADAVDMLPREAFERLTRRPPGGNTLAPTSDRRPAVIPSGALSAALRRLGND